jgi:hypothetical protein
MDNTGTPSQTTIQSNGSISETEYNMQNDWTYAAA